ncbi:hypothetical protein POPTR_014G040100v4 [Populus trichocarpa]|uniref:Uncharacterized protein n=1 Tax=Populus trichocarpa TaxID=3694 RepID=A0A3N7GUH6_POPTR|nr:hypothetical protein POPTR_014G040100v4 [Populus trichocarpa]
MEEKTHLDLVKLCDICGNGGFGELIATCSKCGISQEHLYCTRVLFKDTIEDWICETCTSCTDIASPVSLGCGRKEDSQNCSDALRHESHDALIISDDLRGPHHSKRQHAVKSGKVKFLTAEEVIRLSSGTTKKEPSSRSNFRCTTSHSSVTSKISPTRVPPNPPRIIPSCPIKPYGHGRMQTSSTTNNQQSPRTSKGKNSCPVTVAINSDVEERDLPNILPKLRLYHPHFPALHVTWKGGFKFDVATQQMFYGGFQAQLPCRVHRKAYESSRKIPLILQVKLLPQCDIWEDLFQDSCPDFCDIALYFFPSANIERSKENHASLFRLMETENAVMRSYIDGVELLIFTSKQLHVESQDIIARSGMGNFLWGVFRHAKHDKIICNKFPSLATALGSEHDDHANMGRDEAVDMEIDMVGGTVIGRIDVAVSKESSSRFCVESNKETVDEDASKSNILYSFKDLDSTVEHAISKPEQAHHLVAKKIRGDMASLDPLQSCLGKLSDAMDDAGVPPGFVESLKLKFSNILQENALERVNGDGDRYLKSYPMEVKTKLQNSDNLEQDFSPKLHTKSPRQDPQMMESG